MNDGMTFPLDHFFSGLWFEGLKAKRFNGKFPDSHCWLCFGITKWWVVIEPIGLPCRICDTCKDGKPADYPLTNIKTPRKCPDGLSIRLVSYFEFSRYKSIYEVMNT